VRRITALIQEAVTTRLPILFVLSAPLSSDDVTILSPTTLSIGVLNTFDSILNAAMPFSIKVGPTAAA